MINIVNWLLTRKCNLNCSYCAITKNYKNKPIEYPDMKYYYENEMSTIDIIKCLEKIKKHNPNAFHIFYGGEPLIRDDLFYIIKYCNDENIHYTIISNNTPIVQDKIDNILSKIKIMGFTSSVDPVIFLNNDTDIISKSKYGLKNLKKLKKYINDIVVEMTITNDNIKYIYDTVKIISDEDIITSITFLDIAKNNYYDFSNIHSKDNLVYDTFNLRYQFEKIFNDNLKIHMGKELLNNIFRILPSQMNCNIENNLHNITIDSDGSLRLCLRIRGVEVSKYVNIDNFINDNGELNKYIYKLIKIDKQKYCEYCNWTCMLMSDNYYCNDIIHKEIRDGN